MQITTDWSGLRSATVGAVLDGLDEAAPVRRREFVGDPRNLDPRRRPADERSRRRVVGVLLRRVGGPQDERVAVDLTIVPGTDQAMTTRLAAPSPSPGVTSTSCPALRSAAAADSGSVSRGGSCRRSSSLHADFGEHELGLIFRQRECLLGGLLRRRSGALRLRPTASSGAMVIESAVVFVTVPHIGRAARGRSGSATKAFPASRTETKHANSMPNGATWGSHCEGMNGRTGARDAIRAYRSGTENNQRTHRIGRSPHYRRRGSCSSRTDN